MTRVMQLTKVQETILWKTLSKQAGDDATSLSANIVSLCNGAIDRMKAMSAYAPQYTLHDDRHLLRTTELMGLVLGPVVEQLNVVELALLILSAFFHDQGMVLSENELSSLEANEDFRLFRDNWRVDHPNYSETTAQMNSSFCAETRRTELAGKIAELDASMLTDYLRQTHGNRSAKFIRSYYGSDQRIEVQGVNLSPFWARLCESHTLPSEHLVSAKGFRYDEQIGTYSVNMPFLAAVLRLADILDFDRDRTPDVLLKSIHFTSDVSLLEWEKHRSVEGWSISPDLIRFTIRCRHPAYEDAARTYMDWIDKELAVTKEICRMQPRDVSGYALQIPTHVDRSRIEPLDNAYRFHGLEFSLSRDEVVRLLMTDKLYGREHLCIRELLQNSLDALRYRKALFSETNLQWIEGRVGFRHYVNEDGYEVLECTDNGSGMDEPIIQNHFVKVGRSFYRSPFFERERNRLKSSGNDFDPCSQFGIGFMSCFMLGDRITITTRRDYGYGQGEGTPLIVEIHGLSGLVVVREGLSNQPIGTSVSIVSRRKPSFLDSWHDRIRLCTVLKGYALATEFPISAECSVPELQETVSIPPSPEKTPTRLEAMNVNSRVCFEQDLLQISPLLGGFVRECFLTDDSGLPCLSNSEARWRGKDGGVKGWELRLAVDRERDYYDYDIESSVPVCIDGILVAGQPGRASYPRVGLRLGSFNSHIHSCSPALIDARGSLKPEITPGRTPPDRLFDSSPGWQQLHDKFRQGLGLLWEQLTNYLRQGLAPETFWKLAVVHAFSVGWIPANTLWETLSISLIDNNRNASWRLIRELGEMSMCHSSDEPFVLREQQGLTIGLASDLRAWEQEGEQYPYLAFSMNYIVMLMSYLDVRDGKVVLFPSPPLSPFEPVMQYAKGTYLGLDFFLVDHVGNASNALAIQTPFPTANRNHALTKLSHEARYAKAPTDLQRFANDFVRYISISLSTKKDTPSLDKPDYGQRYLGHLYFSVPWDECDPSLRPSYKLWTQEKGWFDFGEEDFAKWRDLPVRIK